MAIFHEIDQQNPEISWCTEYVKKNLKILEYLFDFFKLANCLGNKKAG